MDPSLKLVESKEEWDALLERCPDATTFHTWDWLKVMESHSIYPFLGVKMPAKLYPLVYSHSESEKVLFPVFLYDSLLFKAALSPPSLVEDHNLGPLFLDRDALSQSKFEAIYSGFLSAFEGFLKEYSISFTIVKSAPGFEDSRPFKWNGYTVDATYHYSIDLSIGIDNVWNNLEGGLRRHIQVAEKKGVTIEEVGRDGIDFVFDTEIRRLESQDVFLPLPKQYLFDLYDTPNHGILRIFIAKYEGKPVSGAIMTSFRKKFSLWLGTPKTELKGVSPNDFLIWHTIKQACNEGAVEYEIPGAIMQNLCKFKSKFNPDIKFHFSAKKYIGLFRFISSVSSLFSRL